MGEQTLGQLIRHFRQRAGLTQTELGARCGYDNASISYMESDHHRPPLRSLRLLASAMNLTGADYQRLILAWPLVSPRSVKSRQRTMERDAALRERAAVAAVARDGGA